MLGYHKDCLLSNLAEEFHDLGKSEHYIEGVVEAYKVELEFNPKTAEALVTVPISPITLGLTDLRDTLDHLEEGTDFGGIRSVDILLSDPRQFCLFCYEEVADSSDEEDEEE